MSFEFLSSVFYDVWVVCLDKLEESLVSGPVSIFTINITKNEEMRCGSLEILFINWIKCSASRQSVTSLIVSQVDLSSNLAQWDSKKIIFSYKWQKCLWRIQGQKYIGREDWNVCHWPTITHCISHNKIVLLKILLRFAPPDHTKPHHHRLLQVTQ